LGNGEFREKGSNLRPSGSGPDVLPTELSLSCVSRAARRGRTVNLPLTGRPLWPVELSRRLDFAVRRAGLEPAVSTLATWRSGLAELPARVLVVTLSNAASGARTRDLPVDNRALYLTELWRLLGGSSVCPSSALSRIRTCNDAILGRVPLPGWATRARAS
jgi:hypothetical protein